MTVSLYMMLMGCKPPGRLTEQHDILFGIASTPADLIPQVRSSWPGSGKIHLDGLRKVTNVDGYKILVTEKTNSPQSLQLFFLNLGGYKPGEFEEYHYKMLTVAKNKTEAINKAKQTAFYKHTGYKGAPSHIDEKYGVDVDDLYEISDALAPELKNKYSIIVLEQTTSAEDNIELGYITMDKLALRTV